MGFRKAFVDVQTGADVDAIATLLTAEATCEVATVAKAGGRITCINVYPALTLVGDAVFTAADDLWTDASHGLVDTDTVEFSAVGTGADGFELGRTYFVVTGTANTYQLALTSGGTPILSTADSVGTWTVESVVVTDPTTAIAAVAGVSVDALFPYTNAPDENG